MHVLTSLFVFLISISVLFSSQCSSEVSSPDVPDVTPPISTIGINTPPQVTNVEAFIDSETDQFVITYDVEDTEDQELDISIVLIQEDNSEYVIPAEYLTGDTGFPISPGADKRVGVDVASDPELTLQNGSEVIFKVIADDRFVSDLSDVIELVEKDRIRTDIEVMEGVRHHSANATNLNRTRSYIRSNFSEYDVDITNQPFPYSDTEGINIIGTKTGQRDTSAFYIIDGHYDTITTTPGADDNASGTAGMLEAMRVLSQFNFDTGIKFIAFDTEELGLVGSRFYARNKPPREEIRGLINFEMIGYVCRGESECRDFPNADTTIYNISSRFSNVLSDEFIAVGETYVPALGIVSASDDGDPNFRRSDHAPFWDIGVDALFITDGANFRTPHYHRSTDTIDQLDMEFATNIVRTAVGTIAKLAGFNHYGTAQSNPVTINE